MTFSPGSQLARRVQSEPSLPSVHPTALYADAIGGVFIQCTRVHGFVGCTRIRHGSGIMSPCAQGRRGRDHYFHQYFIYFSGAATDHATAWAALCPLYFRSTLEAPAGMKKTAPCPRSGVMGGTARPVRLPLPTKEGATPLSRLTVAASSEPIGTRGAPRRPADPCGNLAVTLGRPWDDLNVASSKNFEILYARWGLQFDPVSAPGRPPERFPDLSTTSV